VLFLKIKNNFYSKTFFVKELKIIVKRYFSFLIKLIFGIIVFIFYDSTELRVLYFVKGMEKAYRIKYKTGLKDC